MHTKWNCSCMYSRNNTKFDFSFLKKNRDDEEVLTVVAVSFILPRISLKGDRSSLLSSLIRNIFVFCFTNSRICCMQYHTSQVKRPITTN